MRRQRRFAQAPVISAVGPPRARPRQSGYGRDGYMHRGRPTRSAGPPRPLRLHRLGPPRTRERSRKRHVPPLLEDAVKWGAFHAAAVHGNMEEELVYDTARLTQREEHPRLLLDSCSERRHARYEPHGHREYRSRRKRTCTIRWPTSNDEGAERGFLSSNLEDY